MLRRLGSLLVLTFFSPLALAATSTPADPPPPLKPNLKWPTLTQYEAEIGERGVLLQNDFVLLFAPQRKEKEAKVMFDHLDRAYHALYAIVGQHTKYKIVVYHLPKGWGGTGECVIEYDYANLDFDKSEEWLKQKIPHVSGYIEEMAHNFVSGTKAQFGWEMIGWSIGVKATQRVANTAAFQRQLQETRATQAKTYAKYRALDFTFPAEIEANLCDRIHAHLLFQCEQRYGPRFWPDFFKEVRASRAALHDAVHQAGDDNIRNQRYRITVECFDRLKAVNFKRLLETNQISATVDVKSLHPTESGWDRKFIPKGTVQ